MTSFPSMLPFFSSVDWGRWGEGNSVFFTASYPYPLPKQTSELHSSKGRLWSAAHCKSQACTSNKRAAPPRPPKSLPFHALLLIKAAGFRSQCRLCVKRMRCQVIFILPINQLGGIVPGKPAVYLLFPVVNLPLFPHHWDSVPFHL